ncbi:cation:proton antiporter domain-containing protein [Mucisphaera calidilacus]|uniref:High-affinity Na(+)/H(+) antiporter NhaS3 n=1 Tax=Mucisphaera calidilacus TaxID=2527982 RepID=A0A518BVI6_9BACT|nr:cation:proton antiporter [Mucisphaera calidilacus]QDU70954.1 High-affinity Na(+)/H(+) antiporter NhaS3 [Mucisphaera calidilacus]
MYPILAAGTLEVQEITVLLLALAAMLGLARILGELARSLRQPAVLGEILAGVILGPTVLGNLAPDAFLYLFPQEGAAAIALEGVVVISATMLLLVVGLEVDLETVWRQGKSTVAVSALGVAIPMAMGMTIGLSAPQWLGAGSSEHGVAFAIFIGIALSITALPVIAKILMDLNLAKSDLGALIISSAMLNDLIGWIGFAVVLALITGEGTGGMPVWLVILLTIIFLLSMLTLGRSLLHRTLPYVQAHWSWPGGVMSFVMFIAMLCAAATESLGVHSIFGAFVAGVAIGDSTHLTERTRDTINQFISNIAAPLFFASIGIGINFVDNFNLPLVIVVLLIALTGKIAGCVLGAKLTGMSTRESWAVGFGMAAQGAVGIILGELAREAGLINDELMVAIVVMALTTSLLAGPLIQKVLGSTTQKRLQDYLGDKYIVIEPEAATRDDLIGLLAQRAAEITDLDATNIKRLTLDRERVLPTGLPNGLAVPHARIDALKKPCVIVGTSRWGIDFNAADGRPAQLIFLILTPPDQPEEQIQLLGLIASTFNSAVVRQRAMAAKTSTEFLAALNVGSATPADDKE